MTEMISTGEGLILLGATAVLLIWLFLLAHQSYESRQISREKLIGVGVVILLGVAAVAGVLYTFVPGRTERPPVTTTTIHRERPVKKPINGEGTMANEPVQKLPKNYVCYRTDTPPSLDGTLADPVWQLAPWTEFFVDIEGDLKPVPLLTTRAKMLWDAKYFYIGASLQEPHVWATLTEKNSIIFNDNDFEIFIDPDGDNHNYYEFEINALNTIWELTLVRPYKDGGPPLHGTNIEGLRSAVHVVGTINDPSDVDRGWSLEVAIPWEGLRRYGARNIPPEHGDQWRINFSRVEWPYNIARDKYVKVPNVPESNWVWSPQGVINMHRPETWGYVQFSTAVSGTDVFVPDETLPQRKLLMAIYYAQKRFFETHSRWAQRLDELDLPLGEYQKEDVSHGEMTLTNDGFVASATRQYVRGRTRTLFVNHESRLWEE